MRWYIVVGIVVVGLVAIYFILKAAGVFTPQPNNSGTPGSGTNNSGTPGSGTNNSNLGNTSTLSPETDYQTCLTDWVNNGHTLAEALYGCSNLKPVSFPSGQQVFGGV